MVDHLISIEENIFFRLFLPRMIIMFKRISNGTNPTTKKTYVKVKKILYGSSFVLSRLLNTKT